MSILDFLVQTYTKQPKKLKMTHVWVLGFHVCHMYEFKKKLISDAFMKKNHAW